MKRLAGALLLALAAQAGDSAGLVVHSQDFASFGKLVQETGTRVAPYAFTGREFDPETGLLYYRARYYDPQVSIFITQDNNIGNEETPYRWNPYKYGHGNPQSNAEPFGLSPDDMDDLISQFESRNRRAASSRHLEGAGEDLAEAYVFAGSTAVNALGGFPAQTLYDLITPAQEKHDTPSAGGSGMLAAAMPGGGNLPTPRGIPVGDLIRAHQMASVLQAPDFPTELLGKTEEEIRKMPRSKKTMKILKLVRRLRFRK